MEFNNTGDITVDDHQVPLDILADFDGAPFAAIFRMELGLVLKYGHEQIENDISVLGDG